MTAAMSTFLDALSNMLGDVEDLLGIIGTDTQAVGAILSAPVSGLPAIIGPASVYGNVAGVNINQAVYQGMIQYQLANLDSATAIFSLSNPFVSDTGAMTVEVGQLLTQMTGFLTSLIDWLQAATTIDVVSVTFLGSI